MSKRHKKKQKKKEYSYIKEGKTVKVPPHTQSYWHSQKAIKRMKTIIAREKAAKIFENRSAKQKEIDLKEQTLLMFAIPNNFWKDNINRYDIFGLDGYDAPNVKTTPIFGLPYQVVEYKNEIYQADQDGRFIKSGLRIERLDPDNTENQKRFTDETGKNATRNDRYTNIYSKWLSTKVKLEDVGDELSYRKGDKIDSLYYRLNLFHSLEEKGFKKEEIKRILINAYNNTHKQDVKSFNKQVKEWEEHAYQNAISKIIDGIQKESRERQRDPALSKRAREQYYSPDSQLLLTNILNILDRKGLAPSPQDVGDFLAGTDFSEVKRTNDFAIQYIEERLTPDVLTMETGLLSEQETDIFKDVRRDTKEILEKRLKFAQDGWWDKRDYIERDLGRELIEKEVEDLMGPYPLTYAEIEIFEVPGNEKEFNKKLKIEFEKIK